MTAISGESHTSFLIALPWEAISVLLAALPILYAIFKFTILERLFKQWVLRKQCAQPLKAFLDAEQATLHGLTPLLDSTPIDLASDYVSLVMITQRKSSLYGEKRAVDVQEVLTTDNPVVIVGGPGCGKTTLLQHIRYRLLEGQSEQVRFEKRTIPIFLQASDVARNENSLQHLILVRLESLNLDEETKERFIDIGLAKGWFVLLIDGIDEIDGSIPDFLNKISNFANHYKLCHIIMASRPVSYDLETLTLRKDRPFTEVAIAPLSFEKKKALVEKYAKDSEHTSEVLRLISTRPFMAEITRVTINLMLLLDLISSDSEEITWRSDFYKRAVSTLLFNLPNRKGAALKHGLLAKIQLMSRVCFEALVNGREITMETVTSGDQSGSVEDIFAEILHTSGLVKQTALGKYSFPHRTFAEYFAGNHIVSHFDEITDKEWARIFRSEASEVIAFASNLMENADSLIERVMKIPSTRTKLLANCLANCRSVTVATQKAAEAVIWTSLKDSPDVQVQSSAARYVLSQIHNFPRPAEYKTLYLQLIDKLAAPEKFAAEMGVPVGDVQTQALQFLVHTSSPEIVPRLIQIFKNPESDTYVRFKAGELLASLSSEELLPDLNDAYTVNRDDDVRRFVAQAIVRTKSRQALPTLKAATADEDAVIRDLSIEGIKQIEDGLYLEDATIVSQTGGPKSEKSMIPGCDLSPEEMLSLAADQTSPYRLDAFFQLRNGCPEGREAELFDLAIDPTENEFYRCEAVRLIGTRETPDFADYLERIFKSTQQADPKKGAGARGCAIEYLAHRKCRERVLSCIANCDFSWRLSSEQCKIMWALYEVMRIGGAELSAGARDDIRRACANCDRESNPRVDHWRKRIEQQLGDFAASSQTVKQDERIKA
jgi:HEAT repeat protein